jgi:probable rRNA maturation factor
VPVVVSDEHPSSGLDEDQLRRWAEAVLAAEGYPPQTEVSVTLVGDDRMASLNTDALHREGPTDVLAFPLERLRAGSVPVVDPHGPPLLIGDVVIAPDYVRRQAERWRVDPADEMALMVTHGILHLLGYEHDEDTQAEMMETRERQILAGQGRARR